MTLFGIGGFEFLLIAAIAFFVLGPKRLLEGIREGRRIYSEFKRQRDALQSMITEAIDLEELKKQSDPDGLIRGLKDEALALKDELALDQVAGDLEKATDLNKDFSSGSVSRSNRLNRPPVEVDSGIRDAIPDLELESDELSVEVTDDPEQAESRNDAVDDEVKP
jgi:Sec-independent protein translocase protein TatA